MSYDIYLTDPVSGEALEIPQPNFMGGGNQCLYGTNTLWLNITYNYSAIYKRASRSSKTQSTIWEMKPPLITGCRPRAMQKDLFFSYWQWLECVRMAYGKVIEPILRGFKTCIFFGLNLFFKQRRYSFKTKAKII